MRGLPGVKFAGTLTLKNVDVWGVVNIAHQLAGFNLQSGGVRLLLVIVGVVVISHPHVFQKVIVDCVFPVSLRLPIEDSALITNPFGPHHCWKAIRTKKPRFELLSRQHRMVVAVRHRITGKDS